MKLCFACNCCKLDAEFKRSRTIRQVAPRSGRPKTATYEETIEKYL